MTVLKTLVCPHILTTILNTFCTMTYLGIFDRLLLSLLTTKAKTLYKKGLSQIEDGGVKMSYMEKLLKSQKCLY